MFIRYIMKLMFSGTLPWSNPSLSAYQDKFNEVYSFLWYCLHGDDAVVMPVIIFNDWDTSILTFPTLQTNHNLGVLRNQISAEALTAVIEYLPSQYNKHTLDSKLKRAAYITTLLNAKQHPFIWEYFIPGTIQISRCEKLYYDEVSSFPFLPTRLLKTSHFRNSEACSSWFLSFAPSQHTSHHMGSKCNSHLKTPDAQLAHLHSRQLQWVGNFFPSQFYSLFSGWAQVFLAPQWWLYIKYQWILRYKLAPRNKHVYQEDQEQSHQR